MKERAIICIILLMVAYAICGCENKPIEDDLGEMLLWCQHCQKELGGTYNISDGYWFRCSTCKTVYCNAQWVKVGNKKYVKQFGFDLVREEPVPNYPNYIKIEESDYFIIKDCTFVTEPNESPRDKFVKAWRDYRKRNNMPYDMVIDGCLSAGCDPRYCGMIPEVDGIEPDYDISRFEPNEASYKAWFGWE